MTNTEILRSKSIIEFIDNHTNIKLQKVGQNYSCPCPFHNEKENSFYVNPIKNRWYCYGSCGENGDLIDFVCKLKSLEFKNALDYLCDLYNLKKNIIKTNTKAAKLKEICNFAAKFYEQFLNSELNGKKYLIERKQNFNILKEFGVGYAPAPEEKGWNTLLKELQNFDLQSCEEIGLIKRSERGTYYDAFLGRIIFPIYDLTGNCIGFNTRTVNDEIKPRYLLSSETEIFNRKKIHYGLNKTKSYIQKKKIVVLVEGIFDFFRLYDYGIKNSLPLLGGFFNSLKDAQTYYLMMDFDKAGIKYNSTIGSKLISENNCVRICNNLKDPDELTRKEVILSLKESEDFIEWYIKKIYKYPESIEHKLNVLNEIERLLKEVKDENKLLYSKSLSEKLDLPLGIVLARLFEKNINYGEIINAWKKENN